MQMTNEARAWLDATVRRILARHPLGDAERAGVTYELMSHLHGAGEASAEAAGRTEVTREDLEAALLQAGGAEKLAAAFVQPFARPLERVLLWRRLGAFALDVLFLVVTISVVHETLEFFLEPAPPGAAPLVGDSRLWGLFPWGFHDPALAVWKQATIALASVVVVLGYFTWLEGRDGRTLGKRALELRVMRVDGRPMTPRDAFTRNLVKLSPPLLVLDTVVMLLAFADERQRVSDRIAETIVVRV